MAENFSLLASGTLGLGICFLDSNRKTGLPGNAKEVFCVSASEIPASKKLSSVGCKTHTTRVQYR
ncbi:hypothetical protein CSV72_12000 [Sporosarcina sp. P20a]|nr:hypothetical protein CSV72_12000 [Sporosarcina sp. P20a]